MSGDSPYLDHGHSPAAWTGVGICMVGSLLIAFGVYFGNELLDIMVNGALVAKGEVVTVNGRFGIRVVDVVANGRGRGHERRR